MKASRSWRRDPVGERARSSAPNRFCVVHESIRSVYGEPIAQPQPSLWMSTANAAWRRRKRPPRRSPIPPVQTLPAHRAADLGHQRPAQQVRVVHQVAPHEPAGCGSPDASISRAFSIALAASTKTRPRTVPVVCSGELGSP